MLTVSDLTIAAVGRAEPRSMATCFTPVPVRSLIVMVVGVLALSLELDALDTGEIDGAVGTVERRPGAVGIDAEGLAAFGLCR